MCMRESRGNPATLVKVGIDNSVKSLKQITGDLLVGRSLVIKLVEIISDGLNNRSPISPRHNACEGFSIFFFLFFFLRSIVPILYFREIFLIGLHRKGYPV